MDDLAAPEAVAWLYCHAATQLCALPLAHIVEIMRPQPVAPVADMPGFVLGLAVVRGEAVPVISGALLLGGVAGAAGRFVSLRAGGRWAVLAVDDVLGLRSLDAGRAEALPPLLRAAASEVVSAIAVLDAEFLLFLNLARLVPLVQPRAGARAGAGRA